MSPLDPIVSLPSNPARYRDSENYIRVQIADLEDSITELTESAANARREIPRLECQAAEWERDTALARLKLIELEAKLAKREGASNV